MTIAAKPVIAGPKPARPICLRPWEARAFCQEPYPTRLLRPFTSGDIMVADEDAFGPNGRPQVGLTFDLDLAEVAAPLLLVPYQITATRRLGCLDGVVRVSCPHAREGWTLYARETVLLLDRDGWYDPAQPADWVTPVRRRRNGFAYKADTDARGDEIRIEYGYKWLPSMPRDACRTMLSVTSVRPVRLADCELDPPDAELWNTDNPDLRHETNPWVWVIAVEVVR